MQMIVPLTALPIDDLRIIHLACYTLAIDSYVQLHISIKKPSLLTTLNNYRYKRYSAALLTAIFRTVIYLSTPWQRL